MLRAVLLCLLGGMCVVAGLSREGWWLFLVWFGFSALWLGIAHARGWHRAFAKRGDGTLPLWSKLLHLPFLAYTWLVWHILRLRSREPAQNVVNEDLVIGRRLLASEAGSEFSNFVDLTAEFEEPAPVRRMPGYICFPILDASAPSPESLLAAIASLRPGRTYIHCAQGHGRTALFALAMLLAKGTARDIDEGLNSLKQVRPAVRLNANQRRSIEHYLQQLTRPGR